MGSEHYNTIFTMADEFPKAFNENNARRAHWLRIFPTVQNSLQAIVKRLSDNDFFRENIYLIPEYTADHNASSGLYVQSGNMKVGHNDDIEIGFQIHFQPTMNGRMHCFAYGFNIHNETPEEFDLGITEFSDVNEEKVFELFMTAFAKVKDTCAVFRQ